MTKKKPSDKPGKRGRKSLYDPELHPKTARSLARKGKTNLQIAHAIGVSIDTLQTWLNQYSEFSAALKEGKVPADSKVENSLFKRAVGYKYTEKKVVAFPDGSSRIETTKKEVAPDTTAQIFWLKNRLPGEWRDKQTVELGGEVKFTDARELLTRKLNSLATRAAKKDAPQ
jgi:transposase-like protein